MLATTGISLLRAAAAAAVPAVSALGTATRNSYHVVYDVGNSSNIKWHEGGLRHSRYGTRSVQR